MQTDKLLLDTHVFLWWKTNDLSIASAAKEAIASADVVLVSAASAWEVAIKVAIGRLRLPASFERGVVESGFEKLAVGFSHAETAGALPPHHKDPFDRMLIAQTIVEELTLVSHDRQMGAYDVPILWT
jgi:PIN domain nuclease of toxin-antitoxin system